MKKLLGISLTAGILFSSLLSNSVEAATKPIKVYIDDTAVTFDQQPLIKNNRLLVPFRKISEGVGAQVDWNAKTQTVTVSYKTKKLVLTNNKSVATVNGKQVKMDTPLQTIQGRVMVPLRFLTEGLGAEVQYDNTTKEVNIATYTVTSEKYYYLDTQGNLGNEITEAVFAQQYKSLPPNRELIDSRTYKNLLDGSTGVITERFEVIQQNGKSYYSDLYVEGDLVNGEAVNGFADLQVTDKATNKVVVSEQGDFASLPYDKVIQYTTDQFFSDLEVALP